MRLVDVYGGKEMDAKDKLPYEYDPKALQEFFGKRPLSVLTRIFQVASVGGGFALRLGLDKLMGRIDNNPDLEVRRASELRDIITSLGPFPIKIGQALSIRPDVLSPRSMVELQVGTFGVTFKICSYCEGSKYVSDSLTVSLLAEIV
jgi:aarF domain-containing kinase